MRKRRLRLALLAITLIGVVAWLVWPTTDPAIRAAKEKYARLELGMSEEEVATILGVPPQIENQRYGIWMDDHKGYNLAIVPYTQNPGPSSKLYDYRVWMFAGKDPSAWSHQSVHVQGLFYQGRLVCLWYNEWQYNAPKMWLRKLGERLSVDMSFLAEPVSQERKAIPPP